MNFLLKNLELALDERFLLVGEKLFEEHKVTSLTESVRNLWVATADGFEVEVQVSPSRVKACTCECDVFQDNDMCGHVAAALLALRRHLSERKAKKEKTKKRPPRQHNKLTVNAILDQANPDDLHAFIRRYAKQQRHFSLALRTRFASAVNLPDNREKYRSLLQNLVKSYRKKNNMLSANGVRSLEATCRDLLGQANDAIALEHYAEGLAILQATIEVISGVMRRVEGSTEGLTDVVRAAFTLLRQLLEKPVPPALREEIWYFCREEFARPAYRHEQLATEFLPLLATLADDVAKKQQLLERLQEQWSLRSALTSAHQRALLATLLALLQNPNLEAAALAFEEQLLAAFPSLEMAVQAALDQGLTATADRLLAAAADRFSGPKEQEALALLAFQSALAQQQPDRISQLAARLFTSTGQTTYLEQSREMLGENWPAHRQNLVAELEALPTPRRTDLLTKLYATEGLIEELQQLLLAAGSLDLLQRYAHTFLPDHAPALHKTYELLLDRYLSEHFGLAPTQKMLKVFAHLRSIGAAEVVDKLADFVRKKYPRRMELALELLSL